MFEDCFVFLTMNSLPRYLSSHRTRWDNEDDDIEREAHRLRCSFLKATEVMSSEHDEFPYDAPKLAKYMVHLIAEKRALKEAVQDSILGKRSFGKASRNLKYEEFD